MPNALTLAQAQQIITAALAHSSRAGYKPMAIAVEPVAPAPAEYTTRSKSDSKEALSSSGLVMIETDPSRSKSYQLEEERVQVGRPRRERPKQAAEELSQVETKG